MSNMIPTVNYLAETELSSTDITHEPFHSSHEGFAVLNEEFDELLDEIECIESNMVKLWSLVKNDDYDNQATIISEIDLNTVNAICEAVQVLAMARKYYRDVIK